MEEAWKDIEGYEGLYQVSNKGRVKSLNYHNTKKEKILKLVIDSYGYLQVILCKDKTIKCFKIHRLVAKAFIENPNNLLEVNHKDENKQNNSVENLEWCTHKYNMNYGSRNERARKAIANNTNRSKAISKALSKKVYQYSKYFELIEVWESTKECGRNGFNQGHIADCCNGERKSHKGFLWSYTPLNNKSS